jgi:Holliday junction DNA helicase RuvA
MIGYLKGKVQKVSDKFIIINVSGVGYKVFCNTKEIISTNKNLEDILQEKYESEIEVFVHTVVREDALELFGFLDEISLSLFEKLITISGIGPRGALGILAAGSVQSLLDAMQKGDLGYLTAVSGIGKKTAEKIILELRGALSDLTNSISEHEEVAMALKSLGYQERQYKDILVNLKGENLQDKIKEALKYLGK